MLLDFSGPRSPFISRGSGELSPTERRNNGLLKVATQCVIPTERVSSGSWGKLYVLV